jgi:hypothetical protein
MQMEMTKLIFNYMEAYHGITKQHVHGVGIYHIP